MRHFILAIAAAALAAAGAVSCKSHHAEPEGEPIEIRRLDRAVAQYADADSASRQALVDSFGVEAEMLGQMLGLDRGMGPDSVMLVLSDTRMMEVFQPDVEERLPRLDSLERVLGSVVARIEQRLPRVEVAEVVGVVSPAPHKIIVADDSLVFVALNHYLGTDYPGYDFMPEFEVAEKTPARMPYDVAEALIAINYPLATEAPLMTVNRLIYEGALADAVITAVPGADIWSLMGYAPADRRWLEQNELATWNALITKDLLYSTSESDAARLLRPAPRSFILAQDAPPRIGRYIGYRIVESYKKHHPEVTAESLLSPKFYLDNRTLVESKYAPK